MSVPAEIERKVRQHDNDIRAIYELLTEISDNLVRHGNRLTDLDGKLTRSSATATASTSWTASWTTSTASSTPYSTCCVATAPTAAARRRSCPDVRRSV